MFEFWLHILYGISKLIAFVVIGTAAGSVFEYKNWTKYISYLVKPFLKFSRLPSICGTSLITAFFSNSASSAMLAGANKEGSINRREMIITGVSATFPTHISHLTNALFIIFPLIGPIAVVYYLIIFAGDFLRTLAVLIYNRIAVNDYIRPQNPPVTEVIEYSWKQILKQTQKRIIIILKKVMIIFIPLYILVSYLSYVGFFKTVHCYTPDFLNKFLTPETVSVAVGKLGGLTASATIANTLLNNLSITPLQVLLALLIGNMLSIPFNTIRRNLPATLAIFPKKDGLWIVLITESIRLIINLLVIMGIFIFLYWYT
ncbi:MAG: hypothetical protein K9M56_03200 [Victivallales bacterium]|nr:hypothetical protein [Victivallales bacterium]